MVFVDCLGFGFAAVKRWNEVLCESDDRLNEEEDVSDKTKDGVWGAEMLAVMCEFVVFDDNEGRDEGVERDEVEAEMGEGAGAFLTGCMGWLEEENGFNEKKERAAIEKWVH